MTPGRFVGADDKEDDGVPFEEKFKDLKSRLATQFEMSFMLEERIRKKLEMVAADA